ncbi:MAG: TolC family protein [Chitinophagaceae bacterium]
MTKKFFVLAVILSLLHQPAVFAQVKPYSLPEIWQLVLNNYPSLKAKKETVEKQELQKELVKQSFLPEMNVQAQQSFGSLQNVPGSFFPLPGIYTTTGSNKTNADAATGANLYTSALVQWNFMQFGRRHKQLQVADAFVNISNAMLKQEKWRLLSEATRLYFSALANQAAILVARAETSRLTEMFDLLQSQSAAGLRPGADTLLLKASLLQTTAKEHDHLAAYKTILVQLAALAGIDKAQLAVDTTIFNRVAMALPGAHEALKNHPYLQVLEARIQLAESEKEFIKKDLYPSIGLLAGIGLKGSSIGTDGAVHKGYGAPWQNASGTYLAGVGLTWNFSSLYQNKTKQAIAIREIEAARADRDAGHLQLQAQYAAALSGWEEQHRKLMVSKASLQASREAYSLYEVRYQSGLISLIELLQLQKTLQDAESAYVTTVAAYWNELLNHAETIGDPSLLLSLIKP